MYKVYLDVENKRLLISEKYLKHQLMMESNDKQLVKMFCLGFVYGNSAQGFEIINKGEEFNS